MAELIKTLYVSSSGKKTLVECALISQTGGVLVLLKTTRNESFEKVISVTHKLTGLCIRHFSMGEVKEAKKFARSFYRRLNLREKQSLREENDPQKLANSIHPSVATFVREWKSK